MARERKTESSPATYRMLSHAKKAQRLNTTPAPVVGAGDKFQQKILQDTTRCSLGLNERATSSTTMTCCNHLVMCHDDEERTTKANLASLNYPANMRARHATTTTTTTESSLLFTSSRRPATYRKRPHRSYNLFTTKYLLIAAAAAILVGLICFVSLAESLLLDTQVNTCPLSECKCKWSNGKKSAQCDHKGLRSLPKQLDSDIQVLDMSANHLTQLTPRIFQERRLTNLQRLYLSDCKLAHIADEAFEQLTNLVELDLSQNNLQQVPTGSLELLRYSLRKLSLAHNQIHIIDSAAFSPLSHLSNLDLTHSQVTTLHKNAFAGLHELRELKLGENRLTQLPIAAMSNLPEGLTIDLYGNPWHCDCELRQSIEWMQQHQIQPLLNPTCASPARHKDIRWQNVRPEDFMCPPVILNKQEEIVVGAGSNVTLACSARGSPPLTFVWFQDERNLTVQGTPSGSSGQVSDPPPSTKLLEERRYEIQEELNPPNITTSILYLMNLKLTDTSVFLCWVQNDAGYSMSNFSLIVDDSPPVTGYGTTSGGAMTSLGSSLGRWFGTESVLVVALVFLLLLALTIICLFVLKQVSRSGSNKSTGGNSSKDLKVQHMNGGGNGKLMSADKFASAMNGNKLQSNGRMFAASDDDGVTDDEDDDHSSGHGAGGSTSGSQSSCTKKVGHTRVMADEELDGFIDHLRSGIINMDYHSMSPVIQFNNQKPPASVVSLQQQVVDKRHNSGHLQMVHPDHHQLTQLNHFPSASNASSQAFYGGAHGPSNGSNSMATTVSDLSPSSGSASTSFANNTQTVNPMMSAAHQQQRQYQMATLMRQQQQQQQQQPLTNCDYPNPAQQQQQELATTTSYTSDYQSGYSENPMLQQHLHHPHQQHHQMMPPMYTSDIDMAGAGGNPYLYNPAAATAATTITASRPSSMNGARPDLVQPSNMVYPEMHDDRYSSQQQQQHQYQVRNSPPQGVPFTHIL